MSLLSPALLWILLGEFALMALIGAALALWFGRSRHKRRRIALENLLSSLQTGHEGRVAHRSELLRSASLTTEVAYAAAERFVAEEREFLGSLLRLLLQRDTDLPGELDQLLYGYSNSQLEILRQAMFLNHLSTDSELLSLETDEADDRLAERSVQEPQATPGEPVDMEAVQAAPLPDEPLETEHTASGSQEEIDAGIAAKLRELEAAVDELSVPATYEEGQAADRGHPEPSTESAATAASRESPQADPAAGLSTTENTLEPPAEAAAEVPVTAEEAQTEDEPPLVLDATAGLTSLAPPEAEAPAEATPTAAKRPSRQSKPRSKKKKSAEAANGAGDPE